MHSPALNRAGESVLPNTSNDELLMKSRRLLLLEILDWLIGEMAGNTTKP